MSKGWKYGLIKVAIEDEGTDYESQINLLVELYPLGENGEYDAYSKARIQSIEELQNAQADVKRDGINTWFYDNGTFTWNTCKDCSKGEWDWEPNEKSSYKHPKQHCVAYQQGGMGCPDCYCDASCTDDACPICAGNTPERIDEQTEWLKKVAEDRKKK